jgi:polyisoprenoid-binding protein YceI
MICFSFGKPSAGVFTAQNATVSFVSKANFEKISAKSVALKGTLDIHKRTFSFTIPICSFEGFLNGTQKKHYCNDYVEGDKFPTASFKGKIIEEFDMSQAGTYTVRCKGILNIHGKEKEEIITTTVIVKDGLISASSKFGIILADYGMKISGVNTLVISKDVSIEVKFNMVPEA